MNETAEKGDRRVLKNVGKDAKPREKLPIVAEVKEETKVRLNV